MRLDYFFVIIFLCSSFFGFSQDSGSPLCNGSQPICSSSEFTFPNTFDNTPAENGPNYGCLGSQPNPAWFFLQIGQSGTVQMVIEQSTSPSGAPNLDVDFILYGPFADVAQACEGELTSANTIDCSYSADSVETVTIPNAQVGELYLLLITNFSGNQGYISVRQTSGTGSTDCSILNVLNSCEGSTITLDATTEDADNYVWYEEDLTNPGNYTVIPGVNSATYDVSVEKKYKAEATIGNIFVLETYEFNVNFYEVPVAPTVVTDYGICDNIGGGADGIGNFDLSTMVDDVLNGQDSSVFSVSFHESELDAEQDLNPLDTNYNNNSNPQVIYARIYNSLTPDDLGCYDVASFNLIVNPVPNVEGIDSNALNQVACEYDGNDIEAFDLNPVIGEVETWLANNGQTPSSFDISLYSNEVDANAGNNAIVNVSNYSNESSPGIAENPQTIYVRIADTTPNGLTCVNSNISFQLEVFDAAVAVVPSQHYIICDNTLENGIDSGFGLFNLSSNLVGDGYDYLGLSGLTLHEEILSGLPSHLNPADFTISFYSSQQGADNGIGDPDQLPETFENTIPFVQTIFIRVEDNASQGICYDTAEMILEVLPLPVFNLEDEFILCSNVNGTELLEFPTLDTQLNSTQYDFEWYIDGVLESGFNGLSSITATVPGVYSVIVTNTSTGCTNEIATEDTYTATVYESSPPTVTAEVISQPFTESNSIEVIAEGVGISQFEFSLNHGPWHLGDSVGNVFTYTFTEEDTILLGENTIVVRDVNGCGWTEVQITIMDYPLYFTPNGDGINDTWNIYGMDNQVNAQIYIYDRFGKLIKSISPLGSGWDGTFNGEILPTSDYWFTVKYNNPNNLDGNLNEYSSHFTLKR